MKTVTKTEIGAYPLLGRGKVRDIYTIDEETLLIVTTDRMSAFDVIMNEPIPGKGIILNQITLFWMNKFAPLVKNHIIAADVADFPSSLTPYRDDLRDRSVLVRKAKPLPIECIVRGYLTGSGWKDYVANGTVCGHTLPPHCKESAKITPAIFTPSTKAELGKHDENITRQQASEILGSTLASQVETLSLSLYETGRTYAEERGIIVADTKFEFGLVNDELILIDEVLTPDSSRFWPKESYREGCSQPSFDKQYLRDWLKKQPWNMQPPPPTLTQDVVERTAEKYREAYTILTGKEIFS